MKAKKFSSFWKTNEKDSHGFSAGIVRGANSKEAAMEIISNQIKTARKGEYGPNQVSAKWVGEMSVDDFDKLALKYEDQFVIVGLVDGKYRTSFSTLRKESDLRYLDY